MSQTEEEDELYNDIFEQSEEKADPEVIKNLKDEIEKIQVEKNHLSEKINSLAKSHSQIKKENQILKRNISSLFKTAQNEIERKIRMIDELRLESFRSSRSSSSSNLMKSSPSSTNVSSSQSKHNIESHGHDRYPRDKYNDRHYNDRSRGRRYDRYDSRDDGHTHSHGLSTSKHEGEDRNSKHNPDSYRSIDRNSRVHETSSQSNSHSPSLQQNTKRKELSSRLNESPRFNSEQNSLPYPNTPSIKQKALPPQSKFSRPLEKPPKINPPKAPERVVVQGPPNVFNRRLEIKLNRESKQLYQQAQKEFWEKTPKKVETTPPTCPVLPNPMQKSKEELHSKPETSSTVHYKMQTSKEELEKKPQPNFKPQMKIILPNLLENSSSKIKIISPNKPSVYSNNTCLKQTFNSPVLKVESSILQTILSSPKSSNSNLSLNKTPTFRMDNIPAQVVTKPCSSLIDKIKELEESTRLNKMVTTPCRKTITCLNELHENSLQRKLTARSPAISQCPKTAPYTPPLSIFEPEVQLHCESSCESNEIVCDPTSPITAQSGSGKKEKPGETCGPKGSSTFKETPISKAKTTNVSLKNDPQKPLVKSKQTRKALLKPNKTPQKSLSQPVDFIPVVHLQSPEKKSVTTAKKSKQSLSLLKLGEVSIKVTSTKSKVAEKLTPSKATITKIPDVSFLLDSKSQNDQNEANTAQCTSNFFDEDSQDIFMPNRKRKLVVLESDDETSLPPSKKPIRSPKIVTRQTSRRNTAEQDIKIEKKQEVKSLQNNLESKVILDDKKEATSTVTNKTSRKSKTKSDTVKNSTKKSVKSKGTVPSQIPAEPLLTVEESASVKPTTATETLDSIPFNDDSPSGVYFDPELLRLVVSNATSQVDSSPIQIDCDSNKINNPSKQLEDSQPGCARSNIVSPVKQIDSASQQINCTLNQDESNLKQMNSINTNWIQSVTIDSEAKYPEKPDLELRAAAQTLPLESSPTPQKSLELDTLSLNSINENASLNVTQNDTVHPEATNLSINSDEGCKLGLPVGKSMKENRFSRLSKRRSARIVKAVVKTITITSPEKKEVIRIQTDVKVDLKENSVKVNTTMGTKMTGCCGESCGVEETMQSTNNKLNNLKDNTLNKPCINKTETISTTKNEIICSVIEEKQGSIDYSQNNSVPKNWANNTSKISSFTNELKENANNVIPDENKAKERLESKPEVAKSPVDNRTMYTECPMEADNPPELTGIQKRKPSKSKIEDSKTRKQSHSKSESEVTDSFKPFDAGGQSESHRTRNRRRSNSKSIVASELFEVEMRDGRSRIYDAPKKDEVRERKIPEEATTLGQDAATVAATTITTLGQDAAPVAATTITTLVQDAATVAATTITTLVQDAATVAATTITTLEQDAAPVAATTITTLVQDAAEQKGKSSIVHPLVVEDITMDACDIVGRLMRDSQKPILNMNTSLVSNENVEMENLTQNMLTPEKQSVCNSTPSRCRTPVSSNSIVPSRTDSPTTPVRTVETPCKFDEMGTVSDLKWKTTNAGLKNETFNYSGRKPKKRISHFGKPMVKSPGKHSPGSRAAVNQKRTTENAKHLLLKTKSPLKKELAQAITTSYKVSSYRDIISTEPILNTEKINVLTPRKTPQQPKRKWLENEPKQMETRETKSSAAPKVTSQPKHRQSILQRDIKIKLKASEVDSKPQTSSAFKAENVNKKPSTSSFIPPHNTEAQQPYFLIPEVLEDNARFVSITTKSSTITSATPTDGSIRISKRSSHISLESNSSSSLPMFTLSELQYRNEHSISPFRSTFMNETPFKQLMTGTFACVSPMPETPYKDEATPRKITPENSRDNDQANTEDAPNSAHSDECHMNERLHTELKTPLKPIITTSCSSTDMQNLCDELALTPDGNSKNSGTSGHSEHTTDHEHSNDPTELANDIRCHVESMERAVDIYLERNVEAAVVKTGTIPISSINNVNSPLSPNTNNGITPIEKRSSDCNAHKSPTPTQNNIQRRYKEHHGESSNISKSLSTITQQYKSPMSQIEPLSRSKVNESFQVQPNKKCIQPQTLSEDRSNKLSTSEKLGDIKLQINHQDDKNRTSNLTEDIKSHKLYNEAKSINVINHRHSCNTPAPRERPRSKLPVTVIQSTSVFDPTHLQNNPSQGYQRSPASDKNNRPQQQKEQRHRAGEHLHTTHPDRNGSPKIIRFTEESGARDRSTSDSKYDKDTRNMDTVRSTSNDHSPNMYGKRSPSSRCRDRSRHCRPDFEQNRKCRDQEKRYRRDSSPSDSRSRHRSRSNGRQKPVSIERNQSPSLRHCDRTRNDRRGIDDRKHTDQERRNHTYSPCGRNKERRSRSVDRSNERSGNSSYGRSGDSSNDRLVRSKRNKHRSPRRRDARKDLEKQRDARDDLEKRRDARDDLEKRRDARDHFEKRNHPSSESRRSSPRRIERRHPSPRGMDRSCCRDRGFNPSPERRRNKSRDFWKYHEVSPEFKKYRDSADYKQTKRSPENKEPETPVKKVIVKEIHYYTKTRDSEDERNRESCRQMQRRSQSSERDREARTEWRRKSSDLKSRRISESDSSGNEDRSRRQDERTKKQMIESEEFSSREKNSRIENNSFSSCESFRTYSRYNKMDLERSVPQETTEPDSKTSAPNASTSNVTTSTPDVSNVNSSTNPNDNSVSFNHSDRCDIPPSGVVKTEADVITEEEGLCSSSSNGSSLEEPTS